MPSFISPILTDTKKVEHKLNSNMDNNTVSQIMHILRQVFFPILLWFEFPSDFFHVLKIFRFVLLCNKHHNSNQTIQGFFVEDAKKKQENH